MGRALLFCNEFDMEFTVCHIRDNIVVYSGPDLYIYCS